jgi:hypothetical protein
MSLINNNMSDKSFIMTIPSVNLNISTIWKNPFKWSYSLNLMVAIVSTAISIKDAKGLK